MHVLWAAELQHTALSQALLVLLLLPLRERIGVCFRLSAPLSLWRLINRVARLSAAPPLQITHTCTHTLPSTHPAPCLVHHLPLATGPTVRVRACVCVEEWKREQRVCVCIKTIFNMQSCPKRWELLTVGEQWVPRPYCTCHCWCVFELIWANWGREGGGGQTSRTSLLPWLSFKVSNLT